MDPSSRYLDRNSMHALSFFVENQNERETAKLNKKAVPKRLLLTVVTNPNGTKELACKNQNSPLWDWKDTLSLYFTNKYKLENVLKFLQDKEINPELLPESQHTATSIVDLLDKKIQRHNSKPFTFKKISDTYLKTIKDQVKSTSTKTLTASETTPLTIDDSFQKKVQELIEEISNHTFKTKQAFKSHFENKLLNLEKENKTQSKEARVLYNEQLRQLEEKEPRKSIHSGLDARSIGQKIDSRERTHSKEAAKQWGKGLRNPGTACYAIATLQALRFSHVETKALPEMPERLKEPSRALSDICKLKENQQYSMLEKILAVATIKRERIKSLNELKTKLVEKKEQPEFSKAVSAISRLPDEKQDTLISLIQESLFIKQNKTAEFIASCQELCKSLGLTDDAEKSAILILKTLAEADDTKREKVRQRFVQNIETGEQAKKMILHEIEENGLKEQTEAILQLAFLSTEDRQKVCMQYVRERVDTIHSNTMQDSSKPLDSIVANNFRQLLRLAGFDTRSATSQEDAAELTRTLFQLLGIEDIHLGIRIAYEKLHDIPSPSLEIQTANDTVIALSIKDVPVDISTGDLLSANKVKEEIDPKAMANTDPATMIALRGSALTAEEIATLQKEQTKKVETTQTYFLPKKENAPTLLPLQVKRFEFTPGHIDPQKLFKSIPLKTEIELQREDSNEKIPYKLSAVSIHMGSTPNSGHYYTYVPKIVDGKEIWLEYNDDKVIVHDQTDDIEKVLLDIQYNGYVYFYEKKEDVK